MRRKLADFAPFEKWERWALGAGGSIEREGMHWVAWHTPGGRGIVDLDDPATVAITHDEVWVENRRSRHAAGLGDEPLTTFIPDGDWIENE